MVLQHKIYMDTYSLQDLFFSPLIGGSDMKKRNRKAFVNVNVLHDLSLVFIHEYWFCYRLTVCLGLVVVLLSTRRLDE